MEEMDNNNVDFSSEETPPPEESSNRTFLIVAGILGGITVLALACIAIYAFFVLPRQRTIRQAQISTLTAQANDIATALAATAIAAAATPTFTRTPPPPPTATLAPRTATPVLAVATDTPVPSSDPRTATVAALLTQAAGTQTVVVPTSTALPTTGFADEVGIPSLLGMAVLLVAVIFLARRLRSA
jgi:LPXTG-motif cell wall-anchored protein